jgi:hypothetical protein
MKPIQMKRSTLVAVAKAEIAEWDHPHGLPCGVALAVLFAFIHRLTTGETVQETFFKPAPGISDYEI